MLCLPTLCVNNDGEIDAAVVWPQLEFFASTTISGVHPSGTIIVRANVPLAAESVFPCLGVYEPRGAQMARFSPASVSPVSSKVAINGSPAIDPLTVPLAPASGGVCGRECAVNVGCAGWSFFAYCREPPPSLTLSTAAICTRTPDNWKDLVFYKPLLDAFGPTIDKFTEAISEGTSLPLSVIILKRDIEPGEELLVAFNQFDGIGRLWSYATPSPFLRVSSASKLLSQRAALNAVRSILAGQASAALTESYVKLLEDTAGTDARTTERINVVILNLLKAVKHFNENAGEICTLPFVVPVAPAACVAAVHSIPSARPPKRQCVSAPASSEGLNLAAASFRIPQSFIPPFSDS